MQLVMRGVAAAAMAVALYAATGVIAKADQAGAVSLARPERTLTRPSNGVQHPDLDAAWAEYDEQIETAAKAIEQAIEKELNTAAAAGDLDAALKWKTAGEQFKNDGRIPEGMEGTKPQGRPKPKPTKSESSPQSLVVEAQGRLAKAYEAVEKSLVKSLDLEKAKQVRAEKVMLLSPDAEVTYLSDMKPRDLSVPAEGKPFQPGKISVGGVEREHGNFLCPPSNGSSTVSFAVPQGFSQLIGSVAMNDSATGQKTPLTFKVLDDRNAVLWKSRPVLGRGKIQEFQLEVGGTSLVTLVVECPGDYAWAHGAWIEPRFILANRNEPILLEPYGRWVEPTDDLIRVIEPRGRYVEINRTLGRNNATGLWKTFEPNLYEAKTESGWTIRFRMLDKERIEFRNTGPDGKAYPPYIRKRE